MWWARSLTRVRSIACESRSAASPSRRTSCGENALRRSEPASITPITRVARDQRHARERAHRGAAEQRVEVGVRVRCRRAARCGAPRPRGRRSPRRSRTRAGRPSRTASTPCAARTVSAPPPSSVSRIAAASRSSTRRDPPEQLLQQVVERQLRERDVGHLLQVAHALGGLLGLGAGGALDGAQVHALAADRWRSARAAPCRSRARAARRSAIARAMSPSQPL